MIRKNGLWQRSPFKLRRRRKGKEKEKEEWRGLEESKKAQATKLRQCTASKTKSVTQENTYNSEEEYVRVQMASVNIVMLTST